MASRRMLHTDIIQSDPFLDMPFSAQMLYVQINQSADDDGFCNGARRLANLIGASDGDLQLLISKRFLLGFDNGIVVVKHWRMANSLKNDRLKIPKYPELAARIYIKDNRAYTDHPVGNCPTLLEYKSSYLESKRNPNGIPTEGKGKELKRTEQNGTEVEAGGFHPQGAFSTGLSTKEDIAAATADRKLKMLHGELGKGVVALTESQINILLEKMGLEMFDFYVDKLSSFIILKGAKVKSHYATILKWWMEDSQDGGGQYESL